MPRVGLTPDRVVEEAGLVAEQTGFDGLTLAAVAEGLGVRVPSLYKHVDGLPDLQRRLGLRAKREVTVVLTRAAVGRSRGDALRSVAHAYRDWAVANPAKYVASVRAPGADAADQRASAEAVQVFLDVLVGYGLSGDAAIDATRTFRAALHGFVALEATGGFGLDRPVGTSFDWMVDQLDLALSGRPA